MSLSIRIAHNYIIQIIGKVIATGLGLFAIGIMARYLGQNGFGEYTVIITFVSFLAILADLGLTLVTVQMISQPNVDEEKIMSNLLGLRLVSAVLFLGIAPLIIFIFPYTQIVKLGTLIVSISFFFVALNQVLIGLFQKKLSMDKVSIAEVVNRIVLLVGVILVAHYNLGLLNILKIMVASTLVNFLMLYYYARQFVLIKLKFDFKVWWKIMHKSWPLAITVGFNLIYLKTDTIILSLIKTPGDVGLYGAAYKIIEVLVTLPFIFAGIALPTLTFYWAKKNYEKFNNALQKSFDAMVILCLPMMIGIQFIAKPIMQLVGGKEFIESGPILQILIIACGVIFLQIMSAHAIIAINKQKQIIWAYVFTAITAFIGYLIFIPKYSYFGAAWVTVYSEIFIGAASIFLVWQHAKFFPKMNIFIKSLLASCVMGVVLFFIKDINLIFVIFVASLVYFIILYTLGGLKFVPIKEILKRPM